MHGGVTIVANAQIETMRHILTLLVTLTRRFIRFVFMTKYVTLKKAAGAF